MPKILLVFTLLDSKSYVSGINADGTVNCKKITYEKIFKNLLNNGTLTVDDAEYCSLTNVHARIEKFKKSRHSCTITKMYSSTWQLKASESDARDVSCSMVCFVRVETAVANF